MIDITQSAGQGVSHFNLPPHQQQNQQAQKQQQQQEPQIQPPIDIIQSGGGVGDGNNNTNNSSSPLKVISSTNLYKKKFKADCVELLFTLNFSNSSDGIDTILYKAIEKILNFLKERVEDHQKVGMTFSIPSVPEINPFGIKLSFMSELSVDLIVDLFNLINQSNSSFSSNNVIKLVVLIVNVPFGHGKRCITKNLSKSEIFIHKRSIIEVITSKFDCLPRALILAKCCADNDNDLLRDLLRNEDKFVHQISNLCQIAKVKLNNNIGHSLSDIYKFHSVLSDYCIIVFGSTTDSNKFFFRSNNISIKFKPLFLIFIDSEFHTLKSPKGFFNKNYMCKYCYTLHNNIEHICKFICILCKSMSPCQYDLNSVKKTCIDCFVEFSSQQCYLLHKSNSYGDSNVCENIKFCQKCVKTIDLVKREGKKHICNEKYCETCRLIVSFDHKCYIQNYKKKVAKDFSLIFFDFESEFKYNSQLELMEHIPNLCVAAEVCNLCYKIEDNNFECINCVNRYKIFWSDNESSCITKLISLVQQYRKYTNSVTCLSHNGKNYDMVFLLNELIIQKVDVTPMLSGRKIMQISGNGFRFIDSINFIPMALSKFPKCFGLQNLSKGYYPYKFNTAENINYVGVYPSVEYFGIDNLSQSEKDTFLKWYNKISVTNVFDNKSELLKYCKLDVEILLVGCIKFMVDFYNATGISVYQEGVTIPNCCMLGFRKKFLKPNTIACITSNYTNQSKIANQWLIYENIKAKGTIKFNLCYGEYRLDRGGLMVDGYNPNNDTVYQFWGCYWHGHLKCQKRNPQNCERFKNEPDTRYSDTLKKIENIKSNGYKLIQIWECDFLLFLQKNPDIKSAILQDPLLQQSAIDCRDSIYGGRVEVFKMYHKIQSQSQSNEKIRYLDFTSLYPYVNKNCAYPKGHPKIYYGDACNQIDLNKSHGIIKCLILPPKNLLIPVLPIRSEGRLVFPLCFLCTIKLNVNKCDHSDKERSMVGTWVIAEVLKAISNNYKIITIYEIWCFEVVSGDNGLFTEYVNNFLKSKQECSDWPKDCNTQLKKEAYINSYKVHEGITLDPTKISDNPGLRNLSKLCLNSLWGKLIQSENYSQCKVIHSEEEFYKIICDNTIDIYDMTFFNNDESILIEYKYKDVLSKPSKNINVIIGAFTTAYARLMLFDVIKDLGERVLYVDTDSVIFVESDDSLVKPIVGSFLGELTDECQSFGSDAYITEFVSTGCKSYAIKIYIPSTNSFEYIVKSKGITINSSSSDVVNFNSLKAMVCDENDVGFRNVSHNRFKRLKTLQILSETQSKKLQFTYTKRICNENYNTFPFGY